ncbi:dihydrofolate reductase [Nitrosospira sp. Nl5]|uniref:dihydrofolate reductase n=1 Tax=Nitrosospira sp. Nl5 TaxID=200120 RepID=UPI000892094B|nr:dihydrofolate reductase [Nitrosospira sp. Nl5]SCX82297.1 dihydrofolate reductase [Nitrosospira sp. Nl5]
MTRQRLSLLVAMSQNRVIGKDNVLPWRLPSDLKRFKALTMGHSIIMGRKTYESIGKPLPGRTCIIVTRRPDYEVEGAIVVGSIPEALDVCYKKTTDMETESFVIGGTEIFRQTLPLCNRLYLTEIQRDFDGDVLFPEFNYDEWRETSREKYRLDEDNGLEYDFVILDRKNLIQG